MQVCTDDFVRRLSCPSHVTRDLQYGDFLGQEGKRIGRIVTRLFLKTGPIDRSAIKPCRGAGFQTPQTEAEFFQSFRKTKCWRITDTPGRSGFFANVNKTTQECSRCQNHRTGIIFAPVFGDHTGHAAVIALGNFKVVNRAFDDRQVFLIGQNILHRFAIQLPISLRAWAAHSRSLGTVQHSELDPSAVNRTTHHTVKRVDLANHMPLAKPANSRVARHFSDTISTVCDQCGFRSHARSRSRSLAPGMAPANNNHIKSVIRHRIPR